jgi:uncharacterized membrane protein YeaQ/YmgE (transglycosylase-associated protein family)
MAGESLIIFLVVGAIAGWLAGVIVKGYGFGLLGNVVVGVIGSFIGGWIFGRLGFSSFGFVGELLAATVGAVVLLFVLRFIRRTA